MQTYSCTPKQQNRRALIVFSVFAALLLAAAVLLCLDIGILIVNQTVFIIGAAFAVWISIKYFFTSYTYTITLMNRAPVLLITQRQGRRVTTVYHQELAALTDVHENVSGENNPRNLQVDARYSYFVSMKPARWQNLYFRLEDGQCVSVMLECDEAFLKILHDARLYLQHSAAKRSAEAAESTDDAGENE